MANDLCCNLRLKKSVDCIKKRKRGGRDKNQDSSRNVGSDLLEIGVMRESSTNHRAVALSVEINNTG